MRYLTDADVEALGITPGEYADAVAATCVAGALGRTVMPTKSTASCPGSDAFFHAMPAVLCGKTAGIKWVAGSPANRDRGLPHLFAVMLLTDIESGRPVALLEATFLTAMRTAAVSLVAARHLARKNAHTVAFVGCGVQAFAHLGALTSEFPITSVRAFSRRRLSAERLATAARAQGVAAVVCDEPHDAFLGADIVVTTVPASLGLIPFLSAHALSPGAFVTMVDLGRSWKIADVGVFTAAYTDDLGQSQALSESHSLFQALRFKGDLAGLESGRVRGRRREEEILCFAFPGTALADLAAASLVFDRAKHRGVGTLLTVSASQERTHPSS